MRQTRLLLLFALTGLLAALPTLAVPYGWSDTIGSGNGETAYAICQIPDGGYLVAGDTSSFGHGGQDGWVIKLGPSGVIQWQKAYGGTLNDSLRAIAPLEGGGYLLAGYTLSFGSGNADAWLLKIDDSGAVAWQNGYGGAQWDQVEGLAQTTDGGFVAAGSSQSFGAGDWELWAFKVDGAGALQWQKHMGGPSSDGGKSVAALLDGGVIVGGYAASFGGGDSDIWAVKFNSSGAVVWQKTLGGSGEDNMGGLVGTPDGGALLACSTQSGVADAWLVKLGATGAVDWQKTYGGSGQDLAWSTARCSDGGFLVAGTTYSFGGGKQAWAFKVNSTGAPVWQKAFGGIDEEMFNGCAVTSDSGFALAGYTSSYGAGSRDFYLYKLDSSANVGGSCANGTVTTATAGTPAFSPVTTTALAEDTAVTATPITSSGLATISADDLCIGQGPMQAIAEADVTSGGAPLDVHFSGSVLGGTAPYTYDWNFGDGTPHSAEQNPLHTYNDTGTFTVTFSVTDSGAQSSTDSHLVIQVDSRLKVLPQADPASGTAPLAVWFTSGVGGGQPPYTISWEFQDGTTSSENNPLHIFANFGSYNVRVVAVDALSAVVEGFVTVTVDPAAPCQEWVALPPPTDEDLRGVCWGGQYVAVGGAILASPDGTTWSAQMSVADLQGVAFGAGTFVAVGKGGKVLTSSGNGAWADHSITGAQMADLFAVTYGGGIFVAVGHNAIFTSSTGTTWTKEATSFEGDLRSVLFNGAGFVTVGAPAPGFSAPALLSSDGHSWTPVETQIYSSLEGLAWNGTKYLAVGHGAQATSGIVMDSPDGAAWTVVGYPQGYLLGVTWIGTQFVTVGAQGLLWSSRTGSVWEQQISGTTSNLNAIALGQGSAVAVGLAGAVVRSVALDTCLNATPTATPSSGGAPLLVAFDAHAAGGAPPYAYDWDFGDGAPHSTEAAPSHTYSSVGSYFVVLITTDADSHGVVSNLTIQVTGGGTCSLTCAASASPTSGQAPLAVNFTATATPTNCTGAVTYAWSFGDGGTSADQNPSHTYSAEGSYNWSMTATVQGVTCTKSGTITVTGGGGCSLTCTATASPTSGQAPLAVTFTATATPTNCTGAVTYAWTFGDGGTSADQNPSHTYVSDGSYNWSMTATVQGVTCSKSGTVTVTGSPSQSAWAREIYGFSIRDIQPTQDGGFVATGDCPSTVNSYWDLFVMKFDETGQVVWVQSYTNGQRRGEGQSIRQTSDGGYLVGGIRDDLTGPWVLRLDGSGGILWETALSCRSGINVQVRHASDGGVFVFPEAAGSGFYDGWAAKLTSGGALVWQKRYPDPAYDNTLFSAASLTSDGGFILIPRSTSYFRRVLKVNGGGGIEWHYSLSNAASLSTSIVDVKQTTDGGYILLGIISGSNTGERSAWLCRLDANGGILWQKGYESTISGMYHEAVEPNSVIQTADGGFLMAGNEQYSSAGANIWWAKVDTSGTLLWQKLVTGWPSNGGASNVTVKETRGGGYLISGVGSLLGDISFLCKITASGTIDDACTQDLHLAPIAANSTSTSLSTPEADTDYTPVDVTTQATVLSGTTILNCSSDCFLTCTASASPTSGQAPLAVTFTATATATHCTGTATYAWTFGDGATSSDQNPSHTYTLEGAYTWTMTAIADGIPCTKTGTVSVGCYLTCTATAPTSAVPNAPVAFSSTATPSTLCTGSPTFAWTFGDGATSTDQNPSHTYSADGSYNWSMTATIQGVTCSKSGTITISNCTLACTATVPAAGSAGSPVSFAATATPSGCTGTVAYAWTFGDSASSTEQNPSHTYASVGSYNWTMTATVQGTSCTKSGTIAVGSCNLACTATVPAAGNVGDPIAFASTATPTSCTGAVAYAWTFGDGATSISQNPTHTYAAAGNYDWTMTATVQGISCSKSGTITVTVASCTLTCAAVASPTSGQSPLGVAFDAVTDASHCTGTVTYTWDFGDGGTSTQQYPYHLYSAAGSYNWSVVAALNNVFCSKTGTVTATSGTSCTLTATASALPTSGLAPLPVTFKASATPSHCTGTASYAWTFGDGATSTTQNPNHTYATAGTFHWIMTATIGGVSYSKTGTVTASGGAPCSLTCTATASPSSGAAPLDVTFMGVVFPSVAKAALSGCSGNVAYLWNFGDGTTSALQNPTHTYATGGAFNWSFTAEDSGATCAQTGTVTVSGGGGLPGDCDGNGTVSIGEVQKAINMFLGSQAIGCGVDCNGNGTVSIGEVQKVINAFLGVASSC
jgi:PKD repeat protein